MTTSLLSLPMSILHSKRAKSYAFLLLNAIIWGAAAPIIKYSLNFTDIYSFLFWRYLLASLLFLPFYLKSRPKINLKILLLAILGTPLTLIPLYIGITLTSSLTNSILVATGPLLTILGGFFFLKEKIQKNEKIGIAIALLGSSIVVIGPTLGGGQNSLIGGLLVFLSNLIWTIFLLISKKLKIDSTAMSMTSYLVSLPIFFLLSLYTLNFSLFTLMTPAMPGVIYMAVLGSIIAFWTYLKGQEGIEASEAAVFTYLQPIFAFPLSFFWLKEPLTAPLIIGSLIIALGVFTSESRKQLI